MIENPNDLSRRAVERLGRVELKEKPSHASSQHRRLRHGRPAAERRGHLEQHRQHEHGRLQAPARRVPGPALPERRAHGRAVLRPGHRGADRHPDRRGREGRLRSTASPTRARRPRPATSYDLAIDGPRLLPGAMPSGETAYTRAGNFSVNDEGQLVTEDGYQVSRPSPSRRTPSTCPSPSAGQVQVIQAGADRAPGRRPAGARHLLQRGGPGGHRRQPAAGDRRLGPGHHRRARRRSASATSAGLHRSLQRRRGQRDHRPDRRPARLRDELQGHHHRRRDAAASPPR